jgi:hypothetical protein
MLSSFSEEKKILSWLFPFITISFVSMYISSMLSGTVYVLAFTFTVMVSIPVFDASSITISSKLFTIYVSLPAPPIRVFAPAPPSKVSFPASPYKVSSPAPPFKISAPAPP